MSGPRVFNFSSGPNSGGIKEHIRKLWELNCSNGEKLYPSPVCGMFTTCKKYGLLDYVFNWLQPGEVCSKNYWKSLVNHAVGYFEYSFWRGTSLMFKQMDLFIKVVPEPRLCVWWLLSLTDVRLAKFCRYIFRL